MEAELDARHMGTKEEAHSYLQEKMNFPGHYGKNLDALYDCLCELADAELYVSHREEAVGYYCKIEAVLKEAAAENGGLRLHLGEEGAVTDGR